MYDRNPDPRAPELQPASPRPERPRPLAAELFGRCLRLGEAAATRTARPRAPVAIADAWWIL
ncbi:MAG TPA: hypothetical protein VGX37_04795 [Allosphingosinicella sp.]|jgi:hypothetical protein|nr:hypothetical protein [Allosphingosinicella sp.]